MRASIMLLLALATTLSPSEPNVLDLRRPAETDAVLRVAVDGGSADDPAGREGLARLTARVMLARMREGLGPGRDARIDVAVGRDMTVFSGRSPAGGAQALHEAMARAILSPGFTGESIETQRTAQTGALEALRADPARLAAAAIDAFADRDGPYAHPTEGTDAGIAAIGRDDLVAFHAARYVKGGIAVAVGGAVENALLSRIRRDYEALPDGEPAREARGCSFPAGPRFFVVERPGPGTASIAIGHPLALSPAHPDYAALRVATADLGASLTRDLVTLRSLSAATAVSIDPEAGGATARRRLTFTIAFTTAPENARFAIDIALYDLHRLATYGVDGDALAHAASIVAAGPATDAAVTDVMLGNPGGSKRLPASSGAVTVDDLVSAAARHLHPDRVVIVAVVPDAEAFIARMLEPVAPVTYPAVVDVAAIDAADRAIRGVRHGLKRDDFEVVAASGIFR